MENESSTRTPGASYVSFKTFQSGVQSLRTHGLPERIDRSVWASKSGADQTALLGAFRFLSLIDATGKTQPSLKMLVESQPATTTEKQVLREVLQQSYANVIALNLETITPAQFADAIGKYGPQGSTRDRAIRFFLKAADHCGIKVSARLKERKRGSSPKGNGVRRKANSQEAPPSEPNVGEGNAVAMKVIQLRKAGGSLTLSGTFNPFELVGTERELVYSIIDLMKEFEDAAHKEEQ
ncbi:MAG: hypothetical protein OXF93_16695 [Acidobacteria bacterium]|nr:hypothetical protein [Acidobacteriota bacterium]